MPSSAGGYGSVTFPAGVTGHTDDYRARQPPKLRIRIDRSGLFQRLGYQVAESSSYATVTLQDVWSVPVDLSSLANPATNDDSVTIGATLPADPALPPAHTEGTVAFYDKGTTELGSATVANGNAIGNALQFDGSTNYVNLGFTQNSTLDFTMTSLFRVVLDEQHEHLGQPANDRGQRHGLS